MPVSLMTSFKVDIYRFEVAILLKFLAYIIVHAEESSKGCNLIWSSSDIFVIEIHYVLVWDTDWFDTSCLYSKLIFAITNHLIWYKGHI